MRIIDAHHHIWHYQKKTYPWITIDMQTIARDFSFEDAYSKIYNIHGVSGGILVEASPSLDETRRLLKIAKENNEVLGVVGWVGLADGDVLQQLERIRSMPGSHKLLGFRHALQDEKDDAYILQKAFMNGLKHIENNGLSYDLLIYERQLAAVIKAQELLPNLRFALNHGAKPVIDGKPSKRWLDGMSSMALHPYTFCKISGLVTETKWKAWRYEELAPYLEHLFMSFGEDRLIFGSDWPVCLLSAQYEEVKNIVNRFINTYCKNNAQKIWADNAIHFYRLGQK